MAANISTETYSILHDSRGEDVRDSLCEACEKIAAELLPDAVLFLGNCLVRPRLFPENKEMLSRKFLLGSECKCFR